MKSHRCYVRPVFRAVAFVALAGLSVGCPPIVLPQSQYDLGFDAGFALDDWYWDGYFDGYDTVGASPMYYRGSTIPSYDTPLYDSGYYDGIWYAYNDGYFSDYRYAFILGFSEGYDNAYWPDYLNFLKTDKHTEYKNGGWADGYNDGFTEGRVFGANDYEQNLSSDWMDALKDYESGTDLYFEEVPVGTGVRGPAVLYVYGTDPTTSAARKSLRAKNPIGSGSERSIRAVLSAEKVDLAAREVFRPLDQQAEDDLNVKPSVSERNTRKLRLTTTWLERVNAYVATAKSGMKTLRGRAVTQPSV